MDFFQALSVYAMAYSLPEPVFDRQYRDIKKMGLTVADSVMSLSMTLEDGTHHEFGFAVDDNGNIQVIDDTDEDTEDNTGAVAWAKGLL